MDANTCSHLVLKAIMNVLTLSGISVISLSDEFCYSIIIIIIWPEWQFFNVAGYLYVIEESRERL